ncbi:hypothetical protein [Kitasatospora sp. McL0602]|uniref:hypothetical protein n=1 Tax=Kitasatospora sp. McL0602 TaxID=3439530 RepID=UPI003F8950B8
MTWMPDREAVPRRRRRGSSSPNTSLSAQHTAQYTAQHAAQHTAQPAADWPYDDTTARQRRSGAHRMGIPRILGRRALWVGARLRREG